jgi:hypothetical protein
LRCSRSQDAVRRRRDLTGDRATAWNKAGRSRQGMGRIRARRRVRVRSQLAGRRRRPQMSCGCRSPAIQDGPAACAAHTPRALFGWADPSVHQPNEIDQRTPLDRRRAGRQRRLACSAAPSRASCTMDEVGPVGRPVTPDLSVLTRSACARARGRRSRSPSWSPRTRAELREHDPRCIWRRPGAMSRRIAPGRRHARPRNRRAVLAAAGVSPARGAGARPTSLGSVTDADDSSSQRFTRLLDDVDHQLRGAAVI